ncbi:hypothetical protein [Emcibacter nanhaiensis]|uniref:Uncharacterized protein n=1 Tax=Emcibacter nanhaiensis TaxID=1505037 RepID=A0A501PN96_9PROT|nr:hypothetical protein [Emcibacter nanhaiensis]TPD61567.1 hypothetical protein FIV46_04985 [Emcibacter nanhaiensis]
MKTRIVARPSKKKISWSRLFLPVATIVTFAIFAADLFATGPLSADGPSITNILVGTALFSLSTAFILWAGDLYQRVLR